MGGPFFGELAATTDDYATAKRRINLDARSFVGEVAVRRARPAASGAAPDVSTIFAPPPSGPPTSGAPSPSSPPPPSGGPGGPPVAQEPARRCHQDSSLMEILCQMAERQYRVLIERDFGVIDLAEMGVQNTHPLAIDKTIQHVVRQYLPNVPALIARADPAPVRVTSHEFIDGTVVSEGGLAQQLIGPVHRIFCIAGPCQPPFRRFSQQRPP